MRNKIIGFILALLPVLSIYRIPGIDFPMGMGVLYLVVMPLVLFGHYKRSSGRKLVERYGLFCIYALLITILFRGGIDNEIIGFLLNSVCVLLMLRGGGYLKPFLKSYVFLSLCFSIFLMVQYVALLVFSMPINGILTFLPTNIGEDVTSMRAYDYVAVARISSVFTEPSHFALYAVPTIALLLWNFVEVKFRMLFLAIISVSVLLSTSGNGLVLMLIAYTLFYINKLRGRNAFLVGVIGLLLMVAGYAASEKIETVQYTIDALSRNQMGENSKTYYRVTRGFLVYGNMPFYTQVFGVGYRNSEHFLQAYSTDVVRKYREGDVVFDYYNSIAGILIYFGVIGFVLLWLFISTVWRRSKNYGEKSLLAIMIISCVSASIFNSDTWFMYILIMSSIYHGYITNNINDEEKNRYKRIA